MIWNWNYTNTIVFSWWRTSTGLGLITACGLVAIISMLYELVAGYQRFLDQKAWAEDRAFSSLSLAPGPPATSSAMPSPWARAFFYGMRCYLGILLMLIMMTFNGFLIVAIIIGAIIGHYLIGSGAGNCH